MQETSHFKYEMEDVDCKFCTEYRGKRRGCAHAVCPWLAERIEADIGAPTRAQRSGSRGERRSGGMSELCRCPLRRSEGYGACDDDGYEEALLGSFPRDPELEDKLHTAVQLFHGSLWLDEGHRQRMEALKAREGFDRRRDTPAYFAAMYLLTSDQDTAKRTANCFCRDGIMFSYATTKGISPHGYTLLGAARDIYAQGNSIALNDLADGEIIDTEAFCLIVNALLIARYGRVALELRDRQDCGE